jgi:hypothetical protein
VSHNTASDILCGVRGLKGPSSSTLRRVSGLQFCCGSPSEYFEAKDKILSDDAMRLLSVDLPPRRIFRASVYRSGEVSASAYLVGATVFGGATGSRGDTGPMFTRRISQRGRTSVRRSIENSSTLWRSMITLTIAPALLRPWEKNCCGAARHDLAKHKLKKFRMALSQRNLRDIRKALKSIPEEHHASYIEKHTFRYAWTAELQENGSIHFHMLSNTYFPIHDVLDASGKVIERGLSSLWGMENNSVDVKRIRDKYHAANYIAKYMTKDAKQGDLIQGRRYDISRLARREGKPMTQYFLTDDEASEARKAVYMMREAIESRGGKVIGSGFGASLPRPRKSVEYVDKSTKKKKSTKEIRSDIHRAFLGAFFPVPF